MNSGKESILYGTRSYEEFLQSPSTSNMAYASYEVGYAYAIVADHERAFAWAKRCLDAPHTSGDPYLRASARMLAGESLVNLGLSEEPPCAHPPSSMWLIGLGDKANNDDGRIVGDTVMTWIGCLVLHLWE